MTLSKRFAPVEPRPFGWDFEKPKSLKMGGLGPMQGYRDPQWMCTIEKHVDRYNLL